MCGIFGFMLKEPLQAETIFQILKKLEMQQNFKHTNKTGGYGAGIAIVLEDGNVIIKKVGKKSDNSPVKELEKKVANQFTSASILLSHLRCFEDALLSNSKYSQSAQPYIEAYTPELTIVSVHNGKLKNFSELKSKIKKHYFESEQIGLIDSEIIPHYFGELLYELKNSEAAALELLWTLKGNNTAALLQIDQENEILHLIHKGKTLGLTVWSNRQNEIIFCSNPQPITEYLKHILAIRQFKEKVSINENEDAIFKLSFNLIT